MFKKWIDQVLIPLLNSKRANAAVVSVLGAILVHVGMSYFHFSEQTATAIALGIMAVGGLFIHSQGAADYGKEGLKLLLASPEGTTTLNTLAAKGGIDPKALMPFLSGLTVSDPEQLGGYDATTKVFITPQEEVQVLIPKTLETQVAWFVEAARNPAKLFSIMSSLDDLTKAKLVSLGFPVTGTPKDQVDWLLQKLSSGRDNFMVMLKQADATTAVGLSGLLKAIGKNYGGLIK